MTIVGGVLVANLVAWPVEGPHRGRVVGPLLFIVAGVVGVAAQAAQGREALQPAWANTARKWLFGIGWYVMVYDFFVLSE